MTTHWHRPDVQDVEKELKSLEAQVEDALAKLTPLQRTWMWAKRHTGAAIFGLILGILALELLAGG